MCCDISKNGFDPKRNGSCCRGPNVYNLFSIGSKLGTTKSVTMSSSASLETLSSPPPRISLSNGIIYVDGSSFSALVLTTAPSSTDFTSVSLSPNLSPSLSSSFSSKTKLATTLAPNHSRTNSSTIGIAVGTSIAVVLIIASIVIYRHLRRKGSKTPRNQVEEMDNQIVRLEETHHPQEMSGHRDHELSASARYMRQELPQPEDRFHNPQELSS